MRTALIGATFIFVTGCSTTPEQQSPAAVESRKPAAASAAVPAPRPMASALEATKPAARPVAGTLEKRTVFFAYDQFDVADEYRPLLEAHARHLRANPGTRMLIQGNADERGSREYNLALGQRRAENVKKVLVLLGARDGQIESVSLGEEKPLCHDQQENCWSKNRRGDILYSGEF